jgi:hypothetical protein
MYDLSPPPERPAALQDQIHAYDLLLVGGCVSAEAARDLVVLSRVLDLDVAETEAPGRIWAQLRPLLVGPSGRGPAVG